MNFLLLAVAVFGVSASGPLMAGIAAPALAIAFWRNAIATVALVPWANRARPELAAAPLATRRLTIVAGLALAAHFATWATSLKLTSVAAATAMVSTQVLFVVLLEFLFRNSAVTVPVVVGCLVSLVGVVVISGVDLSLSARALAGDGLALAGAFFAAVYSIAGAEVRRELSTSGYTFVCYGIAAATLLAALLTSGTGFTGFSVRTWALIGLLTLMAQLLGHSIINHVLGWISPLVVSLVLLLEVPGAAVLAHLFLGELLPWATYAGLVLILAGLAVVTLVRGTSADPETLVAD